MKVLVTGGAGFIGSHVVDALRVEGADVTVVDSLDPGVWRYPPPYLRRDVDYRFGDLRHWEADRSLDDVEVVVHLAALGGVGRAAKEAYNVLAANVGGTARLRHAAQSWKHLRAVIVAGSFSVYGSNYTYQCPKCDVVRDAHRSEEDLQGGQFEVLCRSCRVAADIVPITEAAVPAPLETYGASKYMQELCWQGFDSARVHILRFSSAYGTRLRLDDGEATIIAKLTSWVRSGTSPTLFEDGRQIRDWVHVDDICAATLGLLESPDAARLINVCSGVPTRLVEACEILSRLSVTDCPPRIVGGFRPGDMRHCLGDPSVLAALIGRSPIAFSEGAVSLMED